MFATANIHLATKCQQCCVEAHHTVTVYTPWFSEEEKHRVGQASLLSVSYFSPLIYPLLSTDLSKADAATVFGHDRCAINIYKIHEEVNKWTSEILKDPLGPYMWVRLELARTWPSSQGAWPDLRPCVRWEVGIREAKKAASVQQLSVVDMGCAPALLGGSVSRIAAPRYLLNRAQGTQAPHYSWGAQDPVWPHVQGPCSGYSILPKFT